jgi:hypothetical protein
MSIAYSRLLNSQPSFDSRSTLLVVCVTTGFVLPRPKVGRDADFDSPNSVARFGKVARFW